MCTVLLSPGVNPIAVNKYINIYISFYRVNISAVCSSSVCPSVLPFVYVCKKELDDCSYGFLFSFMCLEFNYII